jgi:1-acyl-sn-glycerol-3-phosphate acyltransferase
MASAAAHAVDVLAAMAVTSFARIVTGVRANWLGCAPDPRPRVYYANHTSHGDFVLIWTVLPPALRRRTRPVAGADYWTVSAIRRFFGQRVFRAVLIDRTGASQIVDPVASMAGALDEGSSLILFPEGTRNTTNEQLLPFKSGLYHLAKSRPQIELVPAWIENLNRVMPKGEFIPIPLLCTVTFGTPLRPLEIEEKSSFLERARTALLALAPGGESHR